MWRRVSCEQQLHSSQSILSARGNPMSIVEDLFFYYFIYNLIPHTCAKGNLVHIPEPGTGTVTLVGLSFREFVGVTQKNLETPSRGPGRVFFSV